MAKGVLYCMTTVVPGLIKIGKTTVESFGSRMYGLERNGYSNVVGLKRHFAIEVEDYDEKEILLDEIFSKSRVPNTELFALDIELVVQLLSSFDGKQIYPKTETKEEAFQKATEERMQKRDWAKIPNGTYYIKRLKKSDNRKLDIKAVVNNGKWTIIKGSIIGIHEDVAVPYAVKQRRLDMQIDANGKLLEDFNLGECSPSFASALVINASSSGWGDWKNKAGQAIDIYRKGSK